ncbi:MAG: HAD-IA family hydrolase [Polyangiales bacterium]
MRPVLLWDVMGTLVHDPFFVEMPEFFGMSFDELLEAKHPSAWVDFELGQRGEREFLDQFFADGRAFDQKGFIDTVARSYRWLPGLEPLLAELRDAGIRMHTFSNYPIWYRLIEGRLRLSRYLDWTFVSCLTGTRKPAPIAYENVINELGLPAESCIFVDDRLSNCEAARAQGMRALRFEGVDPLRASLREHGLP